MFQGFSEISCTFSCNFISTETQLCECLKDENMHRECSTSLNTIRIRIIIFRNILTQIIIRFALVVIPWAIQKLCQMDPHKPSEG